MTEAKPFVLAVPSKGRLQENAAQFFARAGLEGRAKGGVPATIAARSRASTTSKSRFCPCPRSWPAWPTAAFTSAWRART